MAQRLFLISLLCLCIAVLGKGHGGDRRGGSDELDVHVPSQGGGRDDGSCSHADYSCETCVKNAKCLWCESASEQCIDYPVGQVIPGSTVCPLDQARWGVCWVNYKILLIVMGSVGGALILGLAICIYCCCCEAKGHRRKYLKEEAKQAREAEQRKIRQDERRAERRSRLDEIRTKYGLKKDGNAYQRFDENEAC